MAGKTQGDLETGGLKDLGAITFDVGGTLIECHPSVGHVYAEVAAPYAGRELSPALLNQRFKQAWGSFKHFGHTKDDWSALVDQVFHGLTERTPSQTFFSSLYDRFRDPDVWRVYKDAVPILQALKARGVGLGVISNWDARLRPLLRAFHLDQYFDEIVISSEAGVCKPDPRIFERACTGLGCSPERTLHIGDSWAQDVEGARAAGLRATWLRREVPGPAGAWLGSLSELDKL